MESKPLARVRPLSLLAIWLLALGLNLPVQAADLVAGPWAQAEKSGKSRKPRKPPGGFQPISDHVPAPVAFSKGATYQLCFVPQGLNCEALLIEAIGQVKSRLLIQAYGFTNLNIARAVIRAKERGVNVRVILDESQEHEKYSSLTLLENAQIPVFIDRKPAIAHNKVMVFDQAAVFTGSFNFTAAAAHQNAENGILIIDPAVATAYAHNWQSRFEQSD